MNLIGHNYIAYKILGKITPYTLAGSHIPDLVPFLPSSVFTFEEIHENHEGLLKFIKNNYPKSIDLPLSMMCHSVKYGSDQYNREIDGWLLKNNKELKQKISNMIQHASKISSQTAGGSRFHNYLWCGVDLFIIKNNPDQIVDKLIDSFKQIDYEKIGEILSEFYKKDLSIVKTNLYEHFKPINANTFKKINYFVRFVQNFLSKLKEGDNLDIHKSIELLEFIYKEFESHWERLINNVVDQVRQKMKPFLPRKSF